MNWGGRELLWEEAGSQTQASVVFLFGRAGDRIPKVRLQRGFSSCVLGLGIDIWHEAVDDTLRYELRVKLLCSSKIICIYLSAQAAGAKRHG